MPCDVIGDVSGSLWLQGMRDLMFQHWLRVGAGWLSSGIMFFLACVASVFVATSPLEVNVWSVLLVPMSLRFEFESLGRPLPGCFLLHTSDKIVAVYFYLSHVSKCSWRSRVWFTKCFQTAAVTLNWYLSLLLTVNKTSLLGFFSDSESESASEFEDDEDEWMD